jgi:hypothetical protein
MRFRLELFVRTRERGTVVTGSVHADGTGRSNPARLLHRLDKLLVLFVAVFLVRTALIFARIELFLSDAVAGLLATVLGKVLHFVTGMLYFFKEILIFL